jgi:hypothetical protein
MNLFYLQIKMKKIEKYLNNNCGKYFFSEFISACDLGGLFNFAWEGA